MKPTLYASIAGLSLLAAAPAVADDQKTLCYVTAASAHAYVTPANEALEARAQELGYDLITLSQDFDVQKGVEQISTCIARNADGMILWPMDAEAYLTGVARAHAAGIKTLLINSPMGEDANAFIESFTGPDNYAQGGVVAGVVNEALDGAGSVVIMSGSPGHGTSIERVEGFTDGLAELGSDIEVLAVEYGEWDHQKSLEVSRDVVLRLGDDIDAVYGIGDMMALGFLDAWLEVRDADSVPAIFGINGQTDAFAAIENDLMVATVLQSPREDGLLAIDTMDKIMMGEEVPAVISMPMTVVNADNIGQFDPAF